MHFMKGSGKCHLILIDILYFQNYITWVENETYSNVTKPRYGSVHPFPLNHILTYLKRQSVTKRLNALGWYSKSLDKV